MRTAEFDRETVLRNAMQAFMTYGYNKTSMPKLTEVTGLHRVLSTVRSKIKKVCY